MKPIVAVPLALVALILLAEENAAFGLLGFGLLTWIAALPFRPSLARLWSERRLPHRDEWVALPVGLGFAIVTFAAAGFVVGGAAALIQGRHPGGDEPITWWGWFLWSVGTGAVAWRELARSIQRTGVKAAIAPALAGLLGGLPLGLGLIIAGDILSDVTHEMIRPVEGMLTAAYFAPLSVLALGMGLTIIVQAWQGQADPAGSVRRLVSVLCGAWALLALGLCLNLAGYLGLSSLSVFGGSASVGFAIPTCLAWIVALLWIRRIAVRSILSAVLIAVLMFFAMAASMAVPTLFLDSEWPSLVAFLVFLPYLAVLGGVAVLVPLLVKLLAWDPAQPPWAWLIRAVQRFRLV